jgi:FKBP-type peptidyl-prolyl cis-trans isomerase
MSLSKTLAFVAAVTLVACIPGDPAGPSDPARETYAASLGVDLKTFQKVSNDLYIKDIVVGTGADVNTGSSIVASYKGYLTDGTLFDSGDNLTATVVDSPNGLITGAAFGIPGMKVGGTRRLVIGSSWAYGANGVPPKIPPNATLVMDFTIKSVK